MAIELDEEFLPLTQAPQHIPGRPHVTTVWRWVNRGVRGHRLEAVAVGGRVFTTRQAIQRFLESLNRTRTEPSPSPAEAPIQVRQQRRIAAAERVLREAGIDR